MLFKIIIVAALLQEFSCASTTKDDLELHYEVIIVPETVQAEFSCDGILISPKFFVAYFPCIEKLFETYNNVSLKVLAGVKVFPGFSGELNAYEQFTYALGYVASTYSKTAIVEVKEPFYKSKKVSFARLPAKGETICESPNAVALFMEESSEQRSRWLFGWFRKVIHYVKVAIKVVKKIKKIVDETKKYIKKVEKIINERRSLVWNRIKYSLKYEPPKGQKKEIDSFVGTTDEISPHMCKEHKGWPTFCGRTIWGFQTMCEQSKTRAGGFNLELSDINEDLDFIAKQTGIKVKHSKEKAKGNGFTPRAANEVILLTIVCALLKLF